MKIRKFPSVRRSEMMAAEIAKPSSNPQIPKTAYQQHADHCRDNRRWSEAAYYYGQVLEDQTSNAGLWIQRGNMLKEAGILKHAEACYKKAVDLQPSDPESHVQLAILRKQQGEFDQAIFSFEEALKLDYKDTAFISQELGFLHRTSNKTIENMFSSELNAPYRIFLSSVSVAPNEQSIQSLSSSLGRTHYSYGFIMKGYIAALEDLGVDFEILSSPEYLANVQQRSSSSTNIHIGFYPPDGPRLVKGAYNILVFAWEFERLQYGYEKITNHAFADPATMLGIADEVWGISDFTSGVAVKAGLKQVHTVPTPLVKNIQTGGRNERPRRDVLYGLTVRLEHIRWRPLAMSPVLQSVLSEQSRQKEQTLRSLLIDTYEMGPPTFFLTILNVYDFRKQIKPVLEAFTRFAKIYSNVFLLVKLTVANNRDIDLNTLLFGNQIADPGEISPPLVSDRIWITSGVFARNDLNTLYDISAFYISSSHGEGQNLPLLEAMGRGVVPVSVDHTAMREYISTSNSIVVPSTFSPFTTRLIDRYRMYNVNAYYVNSLDMLLALQRAQETDDANYSSKSKNAVNIVKERFSSAAFKNSLDATVARAKCLSVPAVI